MPTMHSILKNLVYYTTLPFQFAGGKIGQLAHTIFSSSSHTVPHSFATKSYKIKAEIEPTQPLIPTPPSSH